jgi:hypothetical protein
MLVVRQRGHAVVGQTRWAAPHHHVAMRQTIALGAVVAVGGAKQKHRRQAKRQRHDGGGKVFFVLVLVQREFGAGYVLVDQACLGLEPRVTGLRGSLAQVAIARAQGQAIGGARQVGRPATTSMGRANCCTMRRITISCW